MALNASDLGAAIYTASESFNDSAIDITDPVAMAAYRQAFWTAVATEIINHIKAHGELHVPGTGLTAGSTAITGNSITGTIQ